MSTLVNYNTLETVWQYLFGITLAENEYVEIAIAEGKGFNKAKHVKNLEELKEVVEKYKHCNIAIVPATKEIIDIWKLNKRTGLDTIYRQRIVILDIEDKHEYMTETEVKRLLTKVIEALPPEVKDNIILAGYTGGGGQLWLKLNKWAEKGEIIAVYDWLYKKLADISYIDKKCLRNPSQPQRLLGTINYKYLKGVETKILKTKNPEEVDGLNVFLITKELEGLQELEEEREKKIREVRDEIKNIYELVEEIKRRLRFKDIDSFTNERKGSGYINVSCPFHPPDRNPSFSIFTSTSGYELAYDHHDGKTYDVIRYYQERYNIRDFKKAVEELAKKAGLKLEYTREGKKRFEEEKELKEFDPYEFIRECGILSWKRLKIDGESYYIFEVEDLKGELGRVKLPAGFLLEGAKKFFAKIFAITDKIPPELPAKAKQKAWRLILEIFTKEVEAEERITTKDLLINLIKEIIFKHRTESKKLFRNNPEFCTLIVREEADIKHIYVNLQRLLNKIKEYGGNVKNLGELIEVVKELGGDTSVRVRLGKAVQLRFWEVGGELFEELVKEIEGLTQETESPEELQVEPVDTLNKDILDTVENLAKEEEDDSDGGTDDDYEIPF